MIPSDFEKEHLAEGQIVYSKIDESDMSYISVSFHTIADSNMGSLERLNVEASLIEEHNFFDVFHLTSKVLSLPENYYLYKKGNVKAYVSGVSEEERAFMTEKCIHK